MVNFNSRDSDPILKDQAKSSGVEIEKLGAKAIDFLKDVSEDVAKQSQKMNQLYGDLKERVANVQQKIADNSLLKQPVLSKPSTSVDNFPSATNQMTVGLEDPIVVAEDQPQEAWNQVGSATNIADQQDNPEQPTIEDTDARHHEKPKIHYHGNKYKGKIYNPKPHIFKTIKKPIDIKKPFRGRLSEPEDTEVVAQQEPTEHNVDTVNKEQGPSILSRNFDLDDTTDDYQVSDQTENTPTETSLQLEETSDNPEILDNEEVVGEKPKKPFTFNLPKNIHEANKAAADKARENLISAFRKLNLPKIKDPLLGLKPIEDRQVEDKLSTDPGLIFATDAVNQTETAPSSLSNIRPGEFFLV